MKPGETGLKRVYDATCYSIQGLKAAWKYEEAFRMEVWIMVLVIPATFFLPVTKLEQLALVASLVLVLIVELLNSAVEAVVDRVGDDYHALSGRAKDIGSAAVFVSMLLAGLIWAVILFV
ncbi:diacylglycerol kinase [Photobacterium atrarenae]|uniref:Diacylglycerol kinase n=1 Tax=Photobacterium atrarenae TaxID=865757 RepID=A0ABY5GNP2_9GAMM|nr:diacylglycerol kinase [Photobacterium atrarenae]UTV30705.1 diacylglycerol kinase [Photobacterium atrarenae]